MNKINYSLNKIIIKSFYRIKINIYINFITRFLKNEKTTLKYIGGLYWIENETLLFRRICLDCYLNLQLLRF